MAMVLKFKSSFHRRLFFTLIVLFGLFALLLILFQYQRERTLKAEYVNYDLQIFNTKLAAALGDGVTPEEFLSEKREEDNNYYKELRLTIIDVLGNVVYDSKKNIDSMGNHLMRPEVQQAIKTGAGYAIHRVSESDKREYFYSTTNFGDYIIRSALPYDISLRRELSVMDNHFMWFIFFIAVLIVVVGYVLTHRLSGNIKRLRQFAQQAASGQLIEDVENFPHDELGEISSNIVRMYSQLQHTEAALRQEHELVAHQKEEKERIKKQLTQNINHELKTPVSSIQGYLETILNNPDIPHDTLISFLKKSYAQSNRLANLLKDISTITRLEEASDVIEKENVNITEIVNEIKANVELLPIEKRMRVNCDFTTPIIVHGNATLLHSIFENLMNNALAYSGGRDIFIKLLKETDEDYTFSFSDNGIGVEKEHLSRLFERFYRIDKGRSRKSGGTGLGLSIVKNAVIFHGGTIIAKDSESGGLEFVFNLKK